MSRPGGALPGALSRFTSLKFWLSPANWRQVLNYFTEEVSPVFCCINRSIPWKKQYTEKTFYKHYIKQSTSSPSKLCAHWRSRQLRRLPHQEQAVFHKLKNCFSWMPCLWVGEPVCNAYAVGNLDFQGVPVIMVSLFYPYTESVCVLRSLIPKVLHHIAPDYCYCDLSHIHCCGWWYATYTPVHRNSVYCKTDQLDPLGVYLILGVQEGAFKEAFKFIFA